MVRKCVDGNPGAVFGGITIVRSRMSAPPSKTRSSCSQADPKSGRDRPIRRIRRDSSESTKTAQPRGEDGVTEDMATLAVNPRFLATARSRETHQCRAQRLRTDGRRRHHAGTPRREHGGVRLSDPEVPQADHPLHVPDGPQPGCGRGTGPGGLSPGVPFARDLSRRGPVQHVAVPDRHQSRRQPRPRHAARTHGFDRLSR